MPELRRVVLLGGMGVGKSSVGAELARRLGWQHVDLDREIEQRLGLSVAEVFQRHGAEVFRRLEAELTGELAGASRLVLSPGGGWVTNPALLPQVREGALVVWLTAAPETLLARLDAAPHERRPLLAGPEPLTTLREILQAREPLYRAADLTLDTEGRSVAELAARIQQHLRSARHGCEQDNPETNAR